MKRKILLILLACSTTLVFAARHLPIEPSRMDVAPRDTTDFGEDNDDVDIPQPKKEDKKAGADTQEGPTKRTGFDAMEYILSRRYHATGEEFTKKWYDHLFVQVGLGLEQMVPPSDNYRFNTLSAVHLGVGKQFNRYNSARMTLNLAWGYQQGKDRLFTKYGMRLDHLFSLSSYFSGFQPSRLMDISTILGVGVQYSKLSFKNILYEKEQQKIIDSYVEAYEKYGDPSDAEEAEIIRQNMPKDQSGVSFEGHLGAQLRFFTGPQGYVNIEPYIGLATDKMDLSQNQNWRKIDVFYGINFSYIYYIHNNLSERERKMFIKRRQEGDLIDRDSTSLQTWQRPWFIEYSNGVNFLGNSQMGAGNSMGSDITLSVGRWLSPVIGLRLSGAVHQTTWKQSRVVTSDEGETPIRYYVANMHNIYTGIRLEAMFNPLGFMKNFSWNNPYGAYLLGGVEYGWVDKYQTERLSTRSEAYTLGAHLWYQLSDGLHVFVEPRFMHYVYKIPYTNRDWNKNYTDNGISVSLGLQVATRSLRFRNNEEEEGGYEPLRQIRAGLGGGFYLIHTKENFEGDGGVGLNAKAFAEYHVTPIHAVRASFELVNMKHSNVCEFYDTNFDSFIPEEATITRKGMWDHQFKLGLISVGYQANLSNLFCGYPSWRRFDMSVFAGPTLIMPLGDKFSLASSEMLVQGHEVTEKDPLSTKGGVGAHLGFKLRFKIIPHVSAFVEPTFYMLGSAKLPSIDFLTVKYLQTWNVGVQYEL